MKKGFKKIILDLVKENPGLTAKEYAKVALDRGLCASDSKDPVFSLATTLMKEVREDRMLGIMAKGNRPQRFYPAEDKKLIPDDLKKLVDGVGNKASSPWDKHMTILLPSDIVQALDMLVEVSRFGNRNDALIWLIREGIKAKQLEMEQVKKVVDKIKILKHSVFV